MNRFKKLIKDMYSELYRFQEEGWGHSELAGSTALIILSSMQFFNVLTILVIIQKITKLDIFGYFNDHLAIGMVIPTILLIVNYLTIRPIKQTVEAHRSSRRKSLYYFLITIIFFVASLIMWRL